MAYQMPIDRFNLYLEQLKREYRVFAPVVLKGKGAFTDTDAIRYQEVSCLEEIAFAQKSDFSAKEVLLPITQTLFYFTEDNWAEPKPDAKKILLFVRSCDIHGIKRLDDIYLRNGPPDPYYQALRDKVRFCLMECGEGFDTCFCVSMGTNSTQDYDMLVRVQDGAVCVKIKNAELDRFGAEQMAQIELEPEFVTQNKTAVKLPQNLGQDIFCSDFWREYDARCIGCGRCNFVCPTCTCFSMQDIFYQDNHNVGERRRVWASCMVDGFTDMAGGHAFREKQGDRMRFRVMHKIYDYENRFGRHMCVGCGRCDDNCPEYISFSRCLNKLAKATEVTGQ